MLKVRHLVGSFERLAVRLLNAHRSRTAASSTALTGLLGDRQHDRLAVVRSRTSALSKRGIVIVPAGQAKCV